MISIVVPVYNVKRYLAECVESILMQNYKDWELLLVDDGSLDGSSSICDGYASSDSRIYVIHQVNSGVAAARNRGLDEAKGEWIFFVDSDDMLTGPDVLDIFIRYSGERDYDVISGSCLTGGGGQKQDRVLEGPDRIMAAAYDGNESTVPWNHLIKREILNRYGVRFQSGLSFGEDTLFVFNMLKHCRLVRLIPDITYFYRISDGSLLRPKSPDKLIRKMNDGCKFIDMFEREFERSFLCKSYLETKKLGLIVEIYQKCSIRRFEIYFKRLYHGKDRFNPFVLKQWKLRMLLSYRVFPECLQYFVCRCVFAVCLRK